MLHLGIFVVVFFPFFFYFSKVNFKVTRYKHSTISTLSKHLSCNKQDIRILCYSQHNNQMQNTVSTISERLATQYVSKLANLAYKMQEDFTLTPAPIVYKFILK